MFLPSQGVSPQTAGAGSGVRQSQGRGDDDGAAGPLRTRLRRPAGEHVQPRVGRLVPTVACCDGGVRGGADSTGGDAIGGSGGGLAAVGARLVACRRHGASVGDSFGNLAPRGGCDGRAPLGGGFLECRVTGNTCSVWVVRFRRRGTTNTRVPALCCCRDGGTHADTVQHMSTIPPAAPQATVLAVPVWRLRDAATQAAELDPQLTADDALDELLHVPFLMRRPGKNTTQVTVAGLAEHAGMPGRELLDRYESAAAAGMLRWQHTTNTVLVVSPDGDGG